jgi:hypothetical protein
MTQSLCTSRPLEPPAPLNPFLEPLKVGERYLALTDAVQQMLPDGARQVREPYVWQFLGGLLGGAHVSGGDRVPTEDCSNKILASRNPPTGFPLFHESFVSGLQVLFGLEFRPDATLGKEDQSPTHCQVPLMRDAAHLRRKRGGH